MLYHSTIDEDAYDVTECRAFSNYWNKYFVRYPYRDSSPVQRLTNWKIRVETNPWQSMMRSMIFYYNNESIRLGKEADAC